MPQLAMGNWQQANDLEGRRTRDLDSSWVLKWFDNNPLLYEKLKSPR
jgi:hypothetical protein